MTNRILKKEVIDMADLMEKMYAVMKQQNESIQRIQHKVGIS